MLHWGHADNQITVQSVPQAPPNFVVTDYNLGLLKAWDIRGFRVGGPYELVKEREVDSCYPKVIDVCLV